MKITIKDIAKLANVSKMTVSRVLSGKGHVADETAEKIKKIIKDLNYQPNLIARSLSSQKSFTLGVIIPKTQQLFLDNYIAQVLSGISDVAQHQDYRIMLFPFDSGTGNYLNIARSNLIDGMILLKTKIDDPYLEDLADSEFPFVLVSHKKEDKRFNYVDTENIKGAKLAVQHLYDHGHRKIAFVAGSMDETNAQDRLIGYKEAINDLNLEFEEDYVIYCDFNKDKAYEESKKFLNLKNPPSAIFCSDDYMAIGVIERLKVEGFNVPEDVAVIGFDDIEISAFVNPSVSTIKQPMYEIGRSSAEILLDLINHNIKCPAHRLLTTELIERESS